MTDAAGRRLAAALLALCLAGCGLKGDLYLPPPQDAAPGTAAPAGPEPETGDDERPDAPP